MPDLVKACISRAALRHNLQLLQALSRGTPVCAVVKANAYGHGLPLVVRAYRGLKLMFWGAASLPEALALRRAGAREPALIFRPLDFYDSARNLRELVDAMLEINARATVVNRAGLELAAAGARRRGITARIHIKADTGMGRNGCPAAEAVALARLARTTPGVLVEGFYSHFARLGFGAPATAPVPFPGRRPGGGRPAAAALPYRQQRRGLQFTRGAAGSDPAGHCLVWLWRQVHARFPPPAAGAAAGNARDFHQVD
jgi:hypothetical protein